MKGRFAFVVVLALACLALPFRGIAEAQKGKQQPGAIAGTVQVGCAADAPGVLVYIPGRSFVAITGPSGDFELSSVPPGTYILHVEVASPATSTELTNVIVSSSQTTNVGLITIDDVTDTDPNNCGACGNVCPAPPNSIASCVAGVCQVGTCTAGFADCNQNAVDGCETNVTSLTNCGACGNVCPAPPNVAPSCVAGFCQVGACFGGFADCNSDLSDGCEINVTSDVNNCGACGTVCAPGLACVGSVCVTPS